MCGAPPPAAAVRRPVCRTAPPGSRAIFPSSIGVRSWPLHLCIETSNTAVVRRWVEVASLEEIAEAIDVPSPVGTALCMAAALKKEHEKEGRELVRILLAAGADPTAQDDPHCRIALHTAAMIDDVELVKIILEAGVDVNIRNAQNTTPLHVALNRGAKSCVGLLLAAGANCNIQDAVTKLMAVDANWGKDLFSVGRKRGCEPVSGCRDKT